MSSKSNRWHYFVGCVINGAIASCITYGLASIAHSQYVISKVETMGATVAFYDRLMMTLGDLTGLYAYAIVIAIGLLAAWLSMGGVRRLSGVSRWIVYPLGGVLAMAAIMAAMSLAFPMTPIAPARDADGIIGQCLAGLTGGLAFAWLQERQSRTVRNQPLTGV